MALSLLNNIDSLRAQNKLRLASDKLGTTFERLSSGLRINRPSDDPAGLQVADSLRSDARVAAVAIRNANDGISLTSIADAALQETGNMLTRMAELATQSANGVYSTTQRAALSLEFLALGSEIERIASTTTFNSLTLLSNSQSITLQIGFTADANSRITLTGVLGTLNSLGLASSGSSKLTYSIVDVTSTSSQLAATNALSAVQLAITNLGTTRGTLGAAQSRLGYAINNLTVARENFVAAESRIRDADVAAEVAEMVRLQVVQQAATAVLAQANQQPQVLLRLLE